MLRLARKFLTFWEKPRLSAEVRRAKSLLKPSERYTVREMERRVKLFLRDYAFDKPTLLQLFHRDIDIERGLWRHREPVRDGVHEWLANYIASDDCHLIPQRSRVI
jgi:hypothetical protein